MTNRWGDRLEQMESTCGTLLYELQVAWDEIGQSDDDRDRVLLEIEKECTDVYRSKVDQANQERARLRRAIADAEAELAAIASVLGEPPVHIRQSNQNAGSLKEELKVIVPLLEDTRKRKSDRLNQFLEIVEQIVKITLEIRPTNGTSNSAVDESDLSERRLEELHKQLQSLQKEKSDRIKQVLDHLNTLNSLCMVLGIDFKETIREVHPTLDNNEGSKNISNDTIERLGSMIQTLRDVKLQRMQKLQDLASTMLELWNLMDTPVEEQQQFQSVTCNIAASEHEIIEQDALSINFINYVREEVSRLEQLKASKMKNIVLKKMTDLEELRRRAHLVTKTDDIGFTLDAIEAGAVDASLVLEQIEGQISSTKEEAFSRKEILERVEKWLVACEEESWLEEYNRDENRYSAGRGAHLTLKRAEKARAMVNKIPGIVEALAAKVIAWESERGSEFTYDGVRLLSMLEDYMIAREEKEEERKRQRDHKRLQGQLIAEQEVHFGSRPSPSPRPQSAKKVPRTSTGGVNRRLSLGGGAIMQPPKTDPLTSAKWMRPTKKGNEWPDISPGRRVPNIGGLAAKKNPIHAINTREVDMHRKPFTPLVGVNSIPTTPTRPIHIDSEASKTPVVSSIPCPKTPSTVCAMQMATTPVPACTVQVSAGKTPEMEHSFEERRLDFYLKT